jgi:Rps23 Pro-64 3,4-dihydroxylase Tpa1-like proline 4-hydroxylase
MIDSNIFNQEIFDAQNIQRFKEKFNTGSPFRHVIIDNFLNPFFANKIIQFFPSIHLMKTHYSGLNERKAEDTNFEKLDESFRDLHHSLSSAGFVNFIESLTGIKDLRTINDRLGYGLHQGGNGSFLDIHIDYNIHPLQKTQRRLNFLLFLNAEWESSWGGNLELWDKDVKNCVQSIAPLFNRAVIFECSEISYHGYSKMSLPDNITRKSYYHYFFTKIEHSMNYHDTIFRPRPEESYIKKVTVPVKEYLKNTAKKILLHIGLEKFLK